MKAGRPAMGLEWLHRATQAGEVHTVRVGWTDHLGTWRGKRVPAELFLSGPDRRLGFCDGMIVADVNCDIHEQTPFSNFATGYPDMYLRPDAGTARRVGWQSGEAFVRGRLEDHAGDPLRVAPRNVLDAVAERVRSLGVRVGVGAVLGGRLMHALHVPARLMPEGVAGADGSPDVLRLAAEGLAESGVAVVRIDTGELGVFRVTLEPGSPEATADGLALTKAALRETARAHDLHAVFMTRTPDAAEPSTLTLDLHLSGRGLLAPVDPLGVARGLEELRGLLQPSVTAFKLGPVLPPAVEHVSDGVAVRQIEASSEADAATAISVALACALEDAEPARASEPAPSLGAAARTLSRSALGREWLGADLMDNSVALLGVEQALFDATVTDWEVKRYWVQA